MKTSLTTHGLDEILYLIPECSDEGYRLLDYARIGEPLSAVIGHAPGTEYPHLELRKESNKCRTIPKH